MEPVYPLAVNTEPEPLLAQEPEPVRPKSSGLHAIAIELAAAERTVLPATLGRALHSQVMNWLSLGDSHLANTIHTRQTMPFSLSNLKGFRRQTRDRKPRDRKTETQSGDEFCFRIGVLDGDLLLPLLDGLTAWGTEPISLANCPFVIRQIYSMPGSHPQVGSSDYYLLAKMPKPTDDITLNFLTPTSFKQQQSVQPFPLPEMVFGNLGRRWDTFAPEELRFGAMTWQGLVSAFELKTHALKLEGGAEIGAVGWVRYRFPDPQQARVASILAQFANFSGVGRKTAMGMGQVQC